MFINHQCLEKYFNEMYRSLCLYALNITESHEEAEDVVQQIFVDLLEKATEKKLKVENIKSYLFTIVRNRAIKRMKNQQKKLPMEFVLNLIDENDETVREVEEEARMWDWIDKLPKERRKIFLMAKQEGIKYKEIARRLNISVKTVEGQMGKALKTLRNKAVKIYLFFFG